MQCCTCLISSVIELNLQLFISTVIEPTEEYIFKRSPSQILFVWDTSVQGIIDAFRVNATNCIGGTITPLCTTIFPIDKYVQSHDLAAFMSPFCEPDQTPVGISLLSGYTLTFSPWVAPGLSLERTGKRDYAGRRAK